MTDDIQTTDALTGYDPATITTTSATGTSLPTWRLEADAWRWVKRFGRRHANTMLRWRSAVVIPAGLRARFVTMGLPAEVIDETLREIRALDDWSDVWIETAQRFLGDSRRQTSAKNDFEAAKARWLAALCYHAAQTVQLQDDDRTVVMCRAASASLFAQAQPAVYPAARPVAITWRASQLPGYLIAPETTRPVGVVVLLNGADTAKEETIAWAPAFLRAGYAVLALDSPGTGAATSGLSASADQDDVLDGVYELLQDEPLIDLRRIYVAGVSMGGNQAIRCAAYDRRIAGVIAVTPPYDPPRWLGHASPLLAHEIASFTEGDAERDPADVAAEYSLYQAASVVRVPVLIFGAARDLVVPPSESQLLANRIGAKATLVWYEKAGHCLSDVIPAWTADAAAWLVALDEARETLGAYPEAESLAAVARDALTQSAPEPIVEETLFQDEEETWGARLVDPNEEPLDDDPDLYRRPGER